MPDALRFGDTIVSTSSIVATVVVNWNGAKDTLACLASLEVSRRDHAQSLVIVVDNGSTDDSVPVIARSFPRAHLLCAGVNSGFTGGNNMGIFHALQHNVDYIFLLNNDTLLEPNTLLTLTQVLENEPHYGIATPVIHRFPDTAEIWFGGATLDLPSGTALHENREVPGRDRAPYALPWASGCALLIRANLLKALGGFDDRYFLVWEDVDLCLRARALGSSIALVPEARLYHKISRSFVNVSLTRRYYHVRNNLLLLRLHAGSHYQEAARSVIRLRLRESLRDIKSGTTDAWAAFRITLRALADHRRARYGPYRP